MDLPWSAEPRADTGVTNATLGMWLFIASEVMLFGSLFSSYALLRTGASTWPDQSAILNVPLASANTFVLLASSVAMIAASRALLRGHPERFRRALALALALGVIFLGIKGVEYGDELGRGLRPATSNFIGLYFTMTGLHAIHLAVGILVGAWLWVQAPRVRTGGHARLVNRVQAAVLYWNFVDVVWIAVFFTFYLT